MLASRKETQWGDLACDKLWEPAEKGSAWGHVRWRTSAKLTPLGTVAPEPATRFTPNFQILLHSLPLPGPGQKPRWLHKEETLQTVPCACSVRTHPPALPMADSHECEHTEALYWQKNTQLSNETGRLIYKYLSISVPPITTQKQKWKLRLIAWEGAQHT